MVSNAWENSLGILELKIAKIVPHSMDVVRVHKSQIAYGALIPLTLSLRGLAIPFLPLVQVPESHALAQNISDVTAVLKWKNARGVIENVSVWRRLISLLKLPIANSVLNATVTT